MRIILHKFKKKPSIDRKGNWVHKENIQKIMTCYVDKIRRKPKQKLRNWLMDCLTNVFALGTLMCDLSLTAHVGMYGCQLLLSNKSM